MLTFLSTVKLNLDSELTRRTSTISNVRFTVRSSVSSRANASELCDLIDTSGIVFARLGRAFVDIRFASFSSEAGQAVAFESATLASAFATIQARR